MEGGPRINKTVIEKRRQLHESDLGLQGQIAEIAERAQHLNLTRIVWGLRLRTATIEDPRKRDFLRKVLGRVERDLQDICRLGFFHLQGIGPGSYGRAISKLQRSLSVLVHGCREFQIDLNPEFENLLKDMHVEVLGVDNPRKNS